MKPYCPTCKSTESVRADAWARWDEDTELWVLDSVSTENYGWCENCETDTYLLFEHNHQKIERGEK